MNDIIEESIRRLENSVTTERRVAESVPSNTFMNWLRSMISSGNINIGLSILIARNLSG